ncbi:MarR family transcriptional regulator [Streptomyces capparidis]
MSTSSQANSRANRAGQRPAGPEAEPPAKGESRAVEYLGGRFAEVGLPRMSARVFAALIASPDGALTAAEIGERLSISSGTVSTAVQTLVRIGLITRETVPGSRRDLYCLRDDPWPAVLGIRSRWMRDFAEGALRDIEQIGDLGPGARQRLTDIQDFALFVMPKLDDIVVEWRKHRAERAAR